MHTSNPADHCVSRLGSSCDPERLEQRVPLLLQLGHKAQAEHPSAGSSL